ncbi:MAG: restriction endonuclease [Myxococcota bacterium]|nr:restriction endonuclease [Myxococcota bacterium]
MAKAKAKNKKKPRSIGWLVFLLLVVAGLMAWTLPSHRTPILAGAAVVFCLWALAVAKKQRIATKMAQIDKMTGVAFERFLVQLFKRMGYKVRHVGGQGGDFGADVILHKGQTKIAVQAKNYDKNAVGNDAVQQAVAGASYYDCTEAMVVTNSRFTKAARQQASGSNIPVTLWDRRDLEQLIKRL